MKRIKKANIFNVIYISSIYGNELRKNYLTGEKIIIVTVIIIIIIIYNNNNKVLSFEIITISQLHCRYQLVSNISSVFLCYALLISIFCAC